MQRLINCQKATLLLEQQADQSLPEAVRTSLVQHLRYCAHCQHYAAQTVLIAAWAKAAAAARVGATATLSAAAKERMRARLLAAS